MEHTKMIDDTTDIVHDIEEGTWYFQRYLSGPSTMNSKPYTTEELAREAWDNEEVEWES